MARVIRQNITFRNQRVGLVRADRSGEALERDIQAGADSLIKNAFNVANQEAERKGVDLANNLSAEQLKAVNPETGNLEVLDNSPLLMGLTQRNAYRNVVEKRFRFHLEQDIKEKAQTLATELQNDPKMVSKFQNQFGEFVKGLKKPFGENQTSYLGYINDTAESYLASTKVFLTDKKIKREMVESRQEFSTNLKTTGTQLNAVILSQGSNVDKSKWIDVYNKGKAYNLDNKQSNVIGSTDKNNADNALNSAILSAYTTNLTNSLRSLEGGKNEKFNTKPEIEKQLRLIQDALLTGNNLSGLDDKEVLLTVTEVDGTSVQYTAKSFVEYINKESDGQDKSPLTNALQNGITSVKNEQVNENAINAENQFLNGVQYKAFNKTWGDTGNANSGSSKMYLSADNGNVSNLLGHITNTEKQYGVFADTTKKDSPLKESGAQFQNLTDGSGVNVKAEVLNKWIQSTGIEKVLSKINQTGEKGFAFVNKAQKYLQEMVINQGVESKMSMQKPVFEDATLQKEFEESVTKVSEYYTVTKNGKTLDSYYSVNEINAKFNSLDVNMNKQQTDIKSEKVNNETLNNENVSANQNVIESNMTKGIADSDISIFGNNLDTLNTSLNELNSETYKTDIDLGDGKTLSVDTKGVDVTTRNSITSNVEGAVARSFVGAVDNSFISNDMQIDMGNGNTATVSQLMKSPTAQMGVYESIKQAINSNSDFTISTGSAELDTILIDQYKPVVASINRSSEGMKKDITTKITSATTLLRSGITAEKELAVASRAYNSVISGQHDDTLTKTDTSKQIVNAIYTQNNVGPSFFSTTESLDPNHPATKTMYQMARNGVFDETFIANVNMLVDGKLSNPQQVFALMNHIQQLSAVVNDAGTKEISLFHMAKGDIGANVSDATLAKIEMLNYMINLKGLNAQTANELNGDLIKISEMKSKLTYSGGETPAKIFVSDYALSKDSENANQYKDMHDVLRHHFTETHQEDAPSVINRMAGISKFLTNSNPTLGVDEVLGVLDMIYQKGYMNSNGIIIDPDLRNNEKVQTKYNIDALIPKNELEIFQAKPFDPSQGDFDENYSRFNGMQKQDVWLALIEETLSNKDAMQLYGDMDFVLDTRGTDTGKFNFGAYNPSIQPEVTDTDNIVGTRTLQSERSYLFKEIQNRSGGSLANIRKTQGDKGVQKAIKEREEFQKRLNAINQGEITDSGETTINVYGTKKAPVKVFLVPMKNIMMEQAPDTRGADGGKKTIKFRVMKLSDNGLELEPIMINAPVGDGNSAYVPYVVSYRGANDISPLDYLSISQLENAQKVRSEDVIKDMQPKTFNLDDL